jgi:hypothetical protein
MRQVTIAKRIPTQGKKKYKKNLYPRLEWDSNSRLRCIIFVPVTSDGSWDFLVVGLGLGAFVSAQPLNYLCLAYIAELNFVT